MKDPQCKEKTKNERQIKESFVHRKKKKERKELPTKDPVWIEYDNSKVTCFLTIIISSFAIEDPNCSPLERAESARRLNTSYTYSRRITFEKTSQRNCFIFLAELEILVKVSNLVQALSTEAFQVIQDT